MKNLVCAIVAFVTVFLCSCGEKESDKALYSEASWLNSQMLDMARNSDQLIANASAEYVPGTFTVAVNFANPDFKADYFTRELVEYTLAVIFKEHQSQHLANILNNLAKSKAVMVVDITDADAGSASFQIGSDRLKQLFSKPFSQLGLSQAKTDISRLLEAPMQEMMAQYQAENISYSLTAGFAQYTFTFASPAKYANLNQPSLAGRYVNYFNQQYAAMGEAGEIYRAVLRNMGIEGYRIIYVAENNEGELRAAIPWRLLN